MEIAYKYIQRFQVVRMWGRINLHWADLNNNVNILVGINGSGKTTLLNLIHDYYTGQKTKKEIAESLSGNAISSPVTYIRSFDIPPTRKKDRKYLASRFEKHYQPERRGHFFL